MLALVNTQYTFELVKGCEHVEQYRLVNYVNTLQRSLFDFRVFSALYCHHETIASIIIIITGPFEHVRLSKFYRLCNVIRIIILLDMGLFREVQLIKTNQMIQVISPYGYIEPLRWINYFSTWSSHLTRLIDHEVLSLYKNLKTHSDHEI